MKTQAMQERLEQLQAAGRLVGGESYNLMPSDCRGGGYDIALSPRCDESGDYEVAGILCRVQCSVRVGSSQWHNGIPAQYMLDVAPAAPYQLREGEHAELIHRNGNTISNSYMHRVMASIAIVREDGSKVYRGHSPYWLGTTNTYAAHYISGLSRRDAAAYQIECDQLQAVVDQINATAAQRAA